MTRPGASGRRWFWLRDGLIPVGQAISETIPLYALIKLIDATGAHGLALGYAPLAGMVALAAWLTRLTDLLPLAWYFRRAVLAIFTVLFLVAWDHLTLASATAWTPATTLTLVSRPWRIDPNISGAMLFAAWFLGICLWSRGLWIGVERADARIEARWFIGGMAVLLTLLAIATGNKTAPVVAIEPALRLLVLGYFFVGLLVLALMHAGTLRATGGPAPGASVSWLLAVAVPIAAVLLMGVFLTVGVAPALRLAMRAAVVAGLFAGHVALWIGYWILVFLAWLSSLFPSGTAGVARGRAFLPKPPPPVEVPKLTPQIAVSPADATIVFVVLAVALLFGLIVWLLSRRRADVDDAATEEERDSVWSWSLFLAQLRGVWAALWQRRGALGKSPADTASTQAARGGGDAADIRGLYRRFQQRAAELRLARSPASTPVEFARRLFRSHPAHAPEIRLITEVYDRARYGQKIIAPEEKTAMHDAVLAWEGQGRAEIPGAQRPSAIDD